MKKTQKLRDNKSLNYSKFESNLDEFVNENNIESLTDYIVITSTKDKITYVYQNINNKWEEVQQWISTVGKPSTPTIKGVFSVGKKYEAIGTENSAARYATNIEGEYYYHSILYDPQDEYIKDDSLGVAISHGCIRLPVSGAKWIYDNVPLKSTIIIQ